LLLSIWRYGKTWKNMEVMCFGINPSNENLSKYIRLMHVMYVEKYQQINK